MIKPYKNQEGTRKAQVEQMFNTIAGRYDFLNHFLSFNIDKRWRKKLVEWIKRDLKEKENPETGSLNVLDIATGTGDMAILLSKNSGFKVTGIDLAENMLKIARNKSEKAKQNILFRKGDSEKLSFGDQEFDIVTVAFGVRNFEDLYAGINEMHRILKPGGLCYILEFSKPGNRFTEGVYKFYSMKLLPRLAALFTIDRQAYQYLPDSIEAFPSGENMEKVFLQCGFSKTDRKICSGGIATIYRAIKNQ